MPFTYVQSRRTARGAGWHKRGYRDNGNMWLNIKEGSYGPVHGMDVNENSTITELLNLIYRELSDRLIPCSPFLPPQDSWRG
jgi:hypothetical protein